MSPDKIIIPAPIPVANIPERKECYRRSTVGRALLKILVQMKDEGKLTDGVIANTFLHFDVLMAGHLSRAGPHLNFTCGPVGRFVGFDKNYTFVLNNVQVFANSWRGNDRLSAHFRKVSLIMTPSPLASLARNKSSSDTTYTGTGLALALALEPQKDKGELAFKKIKLGYHEKLKYETDDI